MSLNNDSFAHLVARYEEFSWQLFDNWASLLESYKVSVNLWYISSAA
jgi:hypothetical protein